MRWGQQFINGLRETLTELWGIDLSQILPRTEGVRFDSDAAPDDGYEARDMAFTGYRDPARQARVADFGDIAPRKGILDAVDSDKSGGGRAHRINGLLRRLDYGVKVIAPEP